MTMDFREQVSYQRVWHILSSYRLEGSNPSVVQRHLDEMLGTYPTPLVELALVEVLVKQWATVPLPRGEAFLGEVQAQLQRWVEQEMIVSQITPDFFHQITGLTPWPIFHPRDLSTAPSR